MASSRWKRFAFFEKNHLSLPSEVLEDLIPTVDSSFHNNDRSGGRYVSLAVTTAALPFNSKPETIISLTSDENDDSVPLSEMWSSVMTCNPIESTPTSPGKSSNCVASATAASNRNINLPSQAQAFQDDSNVASSGTAIDGLVLAFVTSRDTDRVHCFDISVRCNKKSNGSNKSDTIDEDLEDLDGWRGYLNPLRSKHKQIVTDNKNERMEEGILSIATCRISSGHGALHMAIISSTNVCVCIDPHLYLSCRRPLSTSKSTKAPFFSLGSEWNETSSGRISAVDIVPGIVAIGTDSGGLHVFSYDDKRCVLRPYLSVPPPPSNDMSITMCKISAGKKKVSIFVAYHRQKRAVRGNNAGASSSPRKSAGVSCYEMPLPQGTLPTPISAPSARYDLDSRNCMSSSLCDAVKNEKDNELYLCVARPDGLYTYSTTSKVDVSPIDGSKLAICLVPPPKSAGIPRGLASDTSVKAGTGFVLVASTDSKSRRDAVDIYDPYNKLVAFHLLLSPGHTAIRAAGVTTPPTRSADGSLENGRSSAVVFTSGGSLVTLREKDTSEKVNLLVQKNLYSAAIFVAYSDPSYETGDISFLYRRHAEYLYRKGEYNCAIEQYINTIGSLEPSHVIFRYLDAPKIPLLVKYLEKLRSQDLTTPVHNELLRTCYLKLNDVESAEAIAISAVLNRSVDSVSLSTMVTKSPKDALATICSFDAREVAEALAVYGAALARLLPRETAGLVVSLCFGTFSPRKLSESQATTMANAKKFLEHPTDGSELSCEAYPVHIFASAFMENPKILRLILTHCNRNKCYLTPCLRRTLLELTLAEWNQAKRTGDMESEKMRKKEAIAALTDSHSKEIGDYDALVIVQLACFEEGELLLYEKLQMGPMLLSHYAKDGSEKARRQMLAMCQTDPEVSADVLGYFVNMVTDRMVNSEYDGAEDGEESDDEVNCILEDIQETLSLARHQGVLPPVRITRILAGEGTGQFSSSAVPSDRMQSKTVPLSVALDYVGDILDESRKEISRLKVEVEEYNQLCNGMETQIDLLLNTSMKYVSTKDSGDQISSRINIEDMYAKACFGMDEREKPVNNADLSREAFWREMDQSEDNFQTISRFFSKNVIQ